jgi:hypothetical protein
MPAPSPPWENNRRRGGGVEGSGELVFPEPLSTGPMEVLRWCPDGFALSTSQLKIVRWTEAPDQGT